MESVRMHDLGAVYDIKIKASKEQVEEIKNEFDSGNSSIFAFENIIKAKNYKYKICLVGGTRRSGVFE